MCHRVRRWARSSTSSAATARHEQSADKPCASPGHRQRSRRAKRHHCASTAARAPGGVCCSCRPRGQSRRIDRLRYSAQRIRYSPARSTVGRSGRGRRSPRVDLRGQIPIPMIRAAGHRRARRRARRTGVACLRWGTSGAAQMQISVVRELRCQSLSAARVNVCVT